MFAGGFLEEISGVFLLLIHSVPYTVYHFHPKQIGEVWGKMSRSVENCFHRLGGVLLGCVRRYLGRFGGCDGNGQLTKTHETDLFFCSFAGSS